MRCAGSFAMMLKCICSRFISMGRASLPYPDLRRLCSPFPQRHFPLWDFTAWTGNVPAALGFSNPSPCRETLPGSWSSVCSQTVPEVRIPPLRQRVSSLSFVAGARCCCKSLTRQSRQVWRSIPTSRSIGIVKCRSERACSPWHLSKQLLPLAT
jgi:hypothetical protein